MKRTLMQIYTKGSIEAVELYQKAFNADLGYNVKSQDGTITPSLMSMVRL